MNKNFLIECKYVFLFLSKNSHLKVFPLFVFLIVVFSALSFTFSGRQSVVVAMDFGLSLIRILFPLLVVFMVQGGFGEEFYRKYYLKTFSYPYSRINFFATRYFVLSFLLIAMLIAMALSLALLVSYLDVLYVQQSSVDVGWFYIATIFLIAVEMLLLTALALLLSVISSSNFFVLIGTLGFALVARSYAGVVVLLASNEYLVGDANGYEKSLSFLYYLLPDLGALDIRAIVLYGDISLLPFDWHWHLARALVYTLALLALGMWALQRKRF